MPPRGGAGAGLGQGKEGYNKGFGGLKRALKMFFGFYPVMGPVAVFCVFFSAAVSAAPPIFLQKVIKVVTDCVEDGTSWDVARPQIISYLIVLVVMYALALALSVFETQIMAVMTQGYLDKLRKEMFGGMQRLPIKYFDTHKHGDIMSHYTNDSDTLRQLVSQAFPSLIRCGTIVIGVFALMLWYSLWMTLVLVAGVFLMFFLTKFVGGGSAKYFVKQQEAVGKTEGYIQEMVNGQKVVKVFNHEDKSIEEFNKINEQLGLHQFVVPYLMSSHPGSTMKDAIALAEYIRKMGYMPEQVQDFYPTPGTVSTTMYYTGLDPLTMKPVYVERDPHRKAMQRALIQFRDPKNYELVKEALLEEHREDLIGFEKTCLIPPRKIVRKAGHVVHSHMAHAAHEDSAGSGKSGSLGGHFRMAHTEHESKSRMTRAAHENNSHMTNAAHGNNSHMAHSEHGNSSGRRNTRGKHGRLERNNGR